MDPSRPEYLRSIEDRVDGPLLFPGDQGFSSARSIWNGSIEHQPPAVLRCRNRRDVVTAMENVRAAGHHLSVKGGGHHVSGSAVSDGGLMLDLSLMNDVTLHPRTSTIQVQAGATWRNVDETSLPQGFVVPGPQDPSVGVAGLTLGGGVGWLSPTFGLTSDNVLSAEIVTATGDVVQASAESNSDLFWAIRGGGGNFGVVTRFEFRVRAFAPEVLAGSLIHDPAELPRLLPRYESFMAAAPPEVQVLIGLMELPEAAYYPRSVHNERVLLLILFYGGDPAVGESIVEPLRAFGDPLMDSVRPRQYLDWQQVGEDSDVKRSYARSQYVETFPLEAIEAIGTHGIDVPSSGSTVFISPRHGAEVSPACDATAYPHRTTAHHVLIESRWDDRHRDDDNIAWARRFHEALRPYSTGAAAMNFLTADEIPERVPAAFGENFERLVRIKRRWDPQNVFRSNPNIDPGAC